MITEFRHQRKIFYIIEVNTVEIPRLGFVIAKKNVKTAVFERLSGLPENPSKIKQNTSQRLCVLARTGSDQLSSIELRKLLILYGPALEETMPSVDESQSTQEKSPMKYLNDVLIKTCLLVIKFYRICISPLFPSRCRYYPSCSSYAEQAIVRFGGEGVYWR